MWRVEPRTGGEPRAIQSRRQGDRATEPRPDARAVAKGDPGVILESSFLGSYTVAFGKGRILHNVHRDDLRPASGCAPFGAALALACVAVGLLVGRRPAQH